MKKIEYGKIISNINITPEIFQMDIYAPEIAAVCKAGQFLELYPVNGAQLLPRPISVCRVDAAKETVSLVYQVIGKGTVYFAGLSTGDRLRILGPCGNGFTPEDQNAVVIVGGGIGTPPLLQLAIDLRSQNPRGEITTFLGFRSHPILITEFQKYCSAVYVATDDGGFGYQGNVVSLMRETDFAWGMTYACGPKPMLRGLTAWLEDCHRPGQLSMEERMACGIGVCVGCVIKTKADNDNGWRYQKVCTDGPVFSASEVIWDE